MNLITWGWRTTRSATRRRARRSWEVWASCSPEFMGKTAGWLHDHRADRGLLGRGAPSATKDDIERLPAHLVNGETYGPEYDALFAEARHPFDDLHVHARGGAALPGVRSAAGGGAETASTARRRGAGGRDIDSGHKIATDPARQGAKVIGWMETVWADAGLHPETFWLGYAAGTASAWKPSWWIRRGIREGVLSFVLRPARPWVRWTGCTR